MNSIFQKYEVAIRAALEASDAILAIYATDFEKHDKADGSPVTAADLASAKIIRNHLASTGIPITGEEKEKQLFAERKTWQKLWCVDPLDGTKEFIRKNDEFVINIALIEDQQPVFGLIASPTRKEILVGEVGTGAFQFSYNDAYAAEKWTKLPPLSEPKRPINIISSRSHYVGEIYDLAKWIEVRYGGYRGQNMGSALKFFELCNQRADVYPRFAPTMEWDIAAGHAIYSALGGCAVEQKSGTPLLYNKEDLTNPHFIIYNPYLKLY